MLELTDMLHETLECREIESVISCQYVGSDFDHDGFGGHRGKNLHIKKSFPFSENDCNA